MNKSEAKAVVNARLHAAIGNEGAAARALSALIRCARTKKSAEAIYRVAVELHVNRHPDFII